MKQKVLFSVLVLLCSIQVMAANLVIERYAGAEMVQDIALIGKWVFVETDLQLLDKEGNVLATEPLANVRKIVFSNESTAVDNVEVGSIVVYPNPTQEVLHIQGATDTTPLRIYTMEGKLVTSTEGQAIDVTSMNNGTYLLQIGTQVARFIKE